MTYWCSGKYDHSHCHYCKVTLPTCSPKLEGFSLPVDHVLNGYVHIKMVHPEVWAKDRELREEFYGQKEATK
jgi:hypothetical protein